MTIYIPDWWWLMAAILLWWSRKDITSLRLRIHLWFQRNKERLMWFLIGLDIVELAVCALSGVLGEIE